MKPPRFVKVLLSPSAERPKTVSSLGVIGSMALGLGHAGPGLAAYHPPSGLADQPLRMTTSLGREDRALVSASSSHPSSGPWESEPFRLRWEDGLAVAQSAPDSAPPDGNTATLSELPSPEDADRDIELPQPAPAERRQSGSRYGVAPIRWGGELSYGYFALKPDKGATASSHFYQITNRASSYILYPWLAQVNGNLSVALVRSGSSGDDESSTRAVSITGGLGLNLFPVSRFPFSADLSVTDSRTDGTLTDSGNRSYRLSLRQSYRPIRGRWNTNGSFSASRLEGEFGSDSVYLLEGNYATQWEKNAFDAHAAASTNEVKTGTNTRNLLLYANHNYRIDNATRVDSNASLTYFDVGQQGGGSSATGVLQVYSVGSWNPQDSPWSASASGRLVRNSSDFGGSGNSTTLAALTIGGSYRASRNLRFSASGSTSGALGGDSSSLTTSLSGAVTYTGDPLTFGNVSYTWGSSGSISHIMSSDVSAQSVSASGNHALSRSWILSPWSVMSGSVSQGVAAFRSSGDSGTTGSSLSHSVNLSLSATPGDASTGTIGTGLSDSRSFGDSSSHFRSAHIQIGGNLRLSRDSILSGHMTWRKTEQQSERPIDPLTGLPIEVESDNTDLNGNINYQHGRVFGIRGMVYSLQFSASSNRGNERQLGNPDATREGKTRSIDQRLNYRIGRLESQLNMRVAEVDGKKNAALFFRVSRSFGAF